MSKGNAFETDILELYFNGTAHLGLAEDQVSTPLTLLTIALHTGDPGEAGDQTTSECAYTGYTRITVARTSGGFTIAGDAVTPVADIDFPISSDGPETASFFSIGTGVSDYLMYSGAISPTILINDGVIPRLTTATSVTED
jgi:hypothetical protein